MSAKTRAGRVAGAVFVASLVFCSLVRLRHWSWIVILCCLAQSMCYCGRGWDGKMMIMCDKCQRWLHGVRAWCSTLRI
jgi:hypothetical protein